MQTVLNISEDPHISLVKIHSRWYLSIIHWLQIRANLCVCYALETVKH